MVTLAVAILAMFAGTMFNNSRITDVKTDLHRHLDDKFALLSLQMKQMEENILRQLGDHETRIQKLEDKKAS